MTDNSELQQQAQQRQHIETAIQHLFAPEDDVLRQTLVAAREAGLPEIQISPNQGKLLQLLAVASQAKRILEIGSLAGYSGIWLARALPTDGHLITLEISEKHAKVVRASFARAGLTDRTEVRVGKALETLTTLTAQAPFDLIFIDADKAPYPQYLEWAIRLSRAGTIIVADNCIRGGKALQASATMDEGTAGLVEYNRLASTDPRLSSLAIPMDDDYSDGFTISVVK